MRYDGAEGMHVNTPGVTPATVARNAEGGTPIRTRLLVLAVAGILPLAVMSGWALFALVQQQRTQVEQAGLEIVRALSTAVDAELEHSILVLNDDARVSLYQLLELEGHRVTAARDGASALDHVRAEPPDVALIDLGLPGMDGYELARRIRADVGEGIRLVALTGYGLPADRSRSKAAGFDLHLVKPIDVQALAQGLRQS
jgi:CheY-like chemotaxis protein